MSCRTNWDTVLSQSMTLIFSIASGPLIKVNDSFDVPHQVGHRLQGQAEETRYHSMVLSRRIVSSKVTTKETLS